MKSGDVGCVRAKRRVGLRRHVPGAAQEIEVVDIQPAQVHLQRLKDIGDQHVLLLGLDPVDVGIELRKAGAIAGEEQREFRPLVRLGNHLLNRGIQLLRRGQARAVLDLNLEPAGIADAAHRRRREDEDRTRPGCR